MNDEDVDEYVNEFLFSLQSNQPVKVKVLQVHESSFCHLFTLY